MAHQRTTAAVTYQLSDREPKPFPWGAVLGAAGCGIATVAFFVATVFHSTTVNQTVSTTSRQQTSEISRLQDQVRTLQAQMAAQAGQYGKLSGQVGGLTHLGQYGDVCTEPGFRFPCAPLG
jgi:hypothetical protein